MTNNTASLLADQFTDEVTRECPTLQALRLKSKKDKRAQLLSKTFRLLLPVYALFTTACLLAR